MIKDTHISRPIVNFEKGAPIWLDCSRQQIAHIIGGISIITIIGSARGMIRWRARIEDSDTFHTF